MADGVEVAKPRKTRGKPTWVDVHVGQRVRQRRTLLGYSQGRLAEALDLTFQQVQKYERGANRLGAGRLFQMAKALDVPVTFFFEDLPDAPDAKAPEATMAEDAQRRYESDLMAQRETLLLVRSYYEIDDPIVRRRLLDLVRSMKSSDNAKSE